MNPTVGNFWGLFTHCSGLETLHSCPMSKYVFFFCPCIIVHGTDVPRFTKPFTHGKTAGFFPFGAMTSKAVVNVYVYRCLRKHNSLLWAKSPDVHLASHMVAGWNFYKTTPNCFPEWLHRFYTPSRNARVTWLIHTLSNVCCKKLSTIFYFCHQWLRCDFSLNFSKISWCLTPCPVLLLFAIFIPSVKYMPHTYFLMGFFLVFTVGLWESLIYSWYRSCVGYVISKYLPPNLHCIFNLT